MTLLSRGMDLASGVSVIVTGAGRAYKPVRLWLKLHRIGYLKCLIESPGLMYYESLYITPRKRGLGYAKWLVRESLRRFDGRVEADLRRGVPELPSIFGWLGFVPNGPSQRYARCRVWYLTNARQVRRGKRALLSGIPAPQFVGSRQWETSSHRWRVRIYECP